MSLDLKLRAQRALQGRFRLEQELGRGGMAVVYRAVDLADQQAVAIKLLLPDVATHLGISRFLREVELAGSLRHPNILAIRATGEADGLPYYVMSLVEGRSLRERMNPGLDSVAEAVEIAMQVSDALAHAHAQGVIHRDIKPENLLLEGARVMVTDFGVGKALNLSGGSSLTDTGFIVGTPAYMSPEQAAGDPDLDGRSDLYSLGLVLYETIGGRVPFTGKTPQQVIASRFTENPPALSQLRDGVPPSLVALVARLMAVAPADRVQDAVALAKELQQVRAELG